MSLFDDCNPIDCALQTLDSLGLNLAKVGIITREWSGGKVGLGNAIDSVVYFSPSPRLRNISMKHENKEGGLEKRAAVVLEMFSKSKYKKEDLELVPSNKFSEKYYLIDGDVYDVTEIQERVTHFNVILTKARKRKLNLVEE